MDQYKEVSHEAGVLWFYVVFSIKFPFTRLVVISPPQSSITKVKPDQLYPL